MTLKKVQKNKLYNRDIYSPRFPTVYMKTDRKKLESNFLKYIEVYGKDTEFLKKIEDTQVRKLVYEGFMFVYDKFESGKGTVRKVIADVEHSTKFLLAFSYVKGINIPIEYRFVSMNEILSSSPTEKSIEKLQKFITKKYPELIELKNYQYDDKKSAKLITDFYTEINSDESILKMRYSYGSNKELNRIIKDMGKEHIKKNISKDKFIAYGVGVDVLRDIQRLFTESKIVDESKLRDYFEKNKFADKNSASIQEFIYELSNGTILGHYFIQVGSGKKIPMTLENVERYMKGQGLKSVENFFYGLSNAAAIAAKEYKSLYAAKADFDKIVSDDNFQKFIENQKELIDKAEEARSYYKYEDSSNSFFTALGKVGQHDNPSDETIQRIFRAEDFNDLPTEIINNVREAAKSVANSPTEYFEIKLKKSVKLNEFVGAVVPEEYKEAIDILKKNGIKHIETYTYDQKDKEKRIKNRIQALNKIANEMKEEVTFEEGGSVSDTELKPSTVGIISSDYSTLMFTDKKGGFSYPTVHFIDVKNDYDAKLLPKPIVLVLHNENAQTPDYISLREIKYAVIPEGMDEAKVILNKYKIPFVTYQVSGDNKESKFNALKSIVK